MIIDDRTVGLNYSNGLLMSAVGKDFYKRLYYNCDYIFAYDEFWVEVAEEVNELSPSNGPVEIICTTRSPDWIKDHFTLASDIPTNDKNWEYGNPEAKKRAKELFDKMTEKYGRVYSIDDGYTSEKLTSDDIRLSWKKRLNDQELGNINVKFNQEYPGIWGSK
jgi:hypothetical protein